MAQNQELRIQSTTPSAPSSSSVIKTYVDASGILMAINSNGTTYQVGTQVVNTIAMLGQTVPTGLSVLLGGAGIAVTGIRYGGTGSANLNTFLGAPNGFLPFIDASGQSIAIPYYTRS
jgi:hypothetical protein